MFVKKFFKWVFFTIITFGIYSFWLSMNIRRYTHKNIRYGDVRLSNECNGFDYLIIILKGYLLSIITLGIYFFAWQRDIFNYYFNNLNMHKGEQTITCSSTATGLDFFILLAGNLLIVVFTLGLGIAWADIRTQKFVCDHVKMKGNINIDDIHQTEEEYKDALGEDSMEFLDIEI